MAICRCMVTLPRDSNNPEDVVVNVWHFSLTGTIVNEAALAQDALQDFYNNIATYITTDMNLASATAKWYDLADPQPRSPFSQSALGSMNSPSGGDALPEELAVCLSYRAVPVSGSPPARRRGRIYIGGLGVSAMGASGSTRRPAAGFITALAGAGGTLLADSEAATNWTWVVYSPTAGTTFAVDNGWVDNSWDIQRRRGLDPTSRTLFGTV